MAEGLAPVQTGDPRLGENRNFGRGKCLMQSAKGGNRHHGVANPIRRAHKNLAI